MKQSSDKDIAIRAEKTVVTKEDAPNGRQFLQTVIAWGARRTDLLIYLNDFKPTVLKIQQAENVLTIIGAGAFFPPLLMNEVECRCVNWCDDILRTMRIQKRCDLTHLVNFIRLGGEHGCPTRFA